jgi:dUTP pyrophosphatase
MTGPCSGFKAPMSAAGKQHLAHRKAQRADDRLLVELSRARLGLIRLMGTERFTWEATTASAALSALNKLEALAMDALNELKEGEQMKIKKAQPDSRIPTLGSTGAGAFDCYAHESTDLGPGWQQRISLGFSMEVPAGHVALLVPRSGMGSKGAHLANVIGVIDSDFRGQVIAYMQNNGDDYLRIKHGDRICQMLIVPVVTPTLEVVDELSDTARGAGGFGSTGVR